jgi:predicted DNA-binding protein (UPF0251 family)
MTLNQKLNGGINNLFTAEQETQLKELIENTELSQKEIAKRLGVSYNTFLLYMAKAEIKVARRVEKTNTTIQETTK